MTDKTLVESFRVGRYTCTLTLPPGADRGIGFMTAEWEPTLPSILTADEIADYRRGRHALLRRAAATLGAAVGVIEY